MYYTNFKNFTKPDRQKRAESKMRKSATVCISKTQD